MTKDELLDAAKAAVADRGPVYGTVQENFDRIANLWTAHLQNNWDHITITAHDVAAMMILMKIARLENTPGHLDSLVDIAGYAACASELGPAKKDA